LWVAVRRGGVVAFGLQVDSLSLLIDLVVLVWVAAVLGTVPCAGERRGGGGGWGLRRLVQSLGRSHVFVCAGLVFGPTALQVALVPLVDSI
jgi:hypothetical protein